MKVFIIYKSGTEVTVEYDPKEFDLYEHITKLELGMVKFDTEKDAFIFAMKTGIMIDNREIVHIERFGEE